MALLLAWKIDRMVVLIITRNGVAGFLNIKGLEKLRGVLEECEYKELKMKLGFKDTDLPDQYFYNKAASYQNRQLIEPANMSMKETELLSILTSSLITTSASCLNAAAEIMDNMSPGP